MSGAVRCAIYTRKSSDEGLEQSFNSLDAQREAGEAYVRSQASEGWRVLAARYDDGGFSGGTMERPGLKQLLVDIERGLMDVVVVYKIDRLTRSLSDFSRIVEIFDKANVSFVSVTQSFNTTNSMGRLMLNVLLSFAQFEREVTGERIRDKIAASKAKGMWMGGVPPLGYDLPAAGTRTLLVNEVEAETVRKIFCRYLSLGSVHALQRELADQDIHSKRRLTGSGRCVGGKPFSRGALFYLLRNRLYLGKIVHRGAVHDGEHDAIVDEDLFERVQQMLDANARRQRSFATQRFARAPLTGKLFDADGEPMSPTISRGKSGRNYRYYVSTSLQQGRSKAISHGTKRLSAIEIEQVVGAAAGRWLAKAEGALDRVRTVHLIEGGLNIEVSIERKPRAPLCLSPGERLLSQNAGAATVYIPLALPLRGTGGQVVRGKRTSNPDAAMIAALRRAHRMVTREQGMPLLTASLDSPYDRKILRLAFLAPDIQRDILAGLQPPGVSLEKLRWMSIPLSWAEQRGMLGWPDAEEPVPREKSP